MIRDIAFNLHVSNEFSYRFEYRHTFENSDGRLLLSGVTTVVCFGGGTVEVKMEMQVGLDIYLAQGDG